MSQEYTLGIFVREEKNRFLCSVCIDGKEEECYIPSSCRLGNFLELAGKEVLLKKNQNTKARTRYTVFALKMRRRFLVLNTSIANEIIANALFSRRFSFLGKRKKVVREYTVDGYKTDIFLPETNTILEIKSIISIEEKAMFPSVYSERAISQLKKAKKLLAEGYKIVYIFVSLNPSVKSVSLSKDHKQTEYFGLFCECVKLGMLYRAYTVSFDGKCESIYKEIPLIT